MTADNKLLYALYRDMRRIRSLEERVSELFVRSESAGSMLHLSIGEEGVAEFDCLRQFIICPRSIL